MVQNLQIWQYYLIKSLFPYVMTKFQQLSKVVEIVKQYLQVNSTKLLSDAGDMPVMYIHSGDSTPIRVKCGRRMASIKDRLISQSVYRSGFTGEDFHMQRGYYKFIDVDGEHHKAPLISDAKPLSLGKTAWFLYRAS